LPECGHRSLIDDECADRLHSGNPLLARHSHAGLRAEPGRTFARRQRSQWPLDIAFHDRHCAAALHGGLGRENLGFHAALGPGGAGASCHRLNLGRDLGDFGEVP
jgi:hypothetical protein